MQPAPPVQPKKQKGNAAGVILLIAVGLIGAGKFGSSALGRHDGAPIAIAVERAAAEPSGRWLTVHGRVRGAV